MIGARFYNAGIGPIMDAEFDRRVTSAGTGRTRPRRWREQRRAATGDAASFGKVSGIAPRPRISVYKACWVNPTSPCGSSDSADTTAAMRGGRRRRGRDQLLDLADDERVATSVETSYLSQQRRGLRRASAGNSQARTGGHHRAPGPSITTTAARRTTATARARSRSTARPRRRLVGRDGNDRRGGLRRPILAHCYQAGATPDQKSPLLRRLRAASPGKIVVCGAAPTPASTRASRFMHAGGAGMIMVNATPNSVNADLHFVPSIHLADTLFARSRPRRRQARSASISKGTIVYDADAPFTASFSSRGPIRQAAATSSSRTSSRRAGHPRRGRPAREPRPGLRPLQRHVDVEPAHHGARRAHASGPSGLVADDDQVGADDDRHQGHDTTRSTGAPVTSTRTRRSTRASCSTATWTDWLSFLKGQNLYTGPKPAMDASDLNSASIAIGDMAGAQTVKRTPSVGSKSEKYTFSTTGLPGIRRPVRELVHGGAGSSTPWTVTFLNTGAP